MRSYTFSLLFFFSFFAASTVAQEADTFTLIPDWEVGMKAAYELSVKYESGMGMPGFQKGDVHSKLRLSVLDKKDSFYLVEIRIDSFTDRSPKNKYRDEGGNRFDFMNETPKILWPIERTVLKVGMDGREMGIDNIEEVKRTIKSEELGAWPQMAAADSLFPHLGSDSGKGRDYIEFEAEMYGRQLYSLLFDPMGDTLILDKPFNRWPGLNYSMLGEGDITCHAEMDDQNPNVLNYEIKMASNMDLSDHKESIEKSWEEIPDSVKFPGFEMMMEQFSETISNNMKEHRKEILLDKAIPLSVFDLEANSMTISFQKIYDEKIIELKLVGE